MIFSFLVSPFTTKMKKLPIHADSPVRKLLFKCGIMRPYTSATKQMRDIILDYFLSVIKLLYAFFEVLKKLFRLFYASEIIQLWKLLQKELQMQLQILPLMQLRSFPQQMHRQMQQKQTEMLKLKRWKLRKKSYCSLQEQSSNK